MTQTAEAQFPFFSMFTRQVCPDPVTVVAFFDDPRAPEAVITKLVRAGWEVRIADGSDFRYGAGGPGGTGAVMAITMRRAGGGTRRALDAVGDAAFPPHDGGWVLRGAVATGPEGVCVQGCNLPLLS